MATIEERVVNLTLGLINDEGAIISSADANQLWQLLCGSMVFFMHAGFTMLEAGSIHKSSVANIMFKNVATVSIGVLTYWFVGFAFAFSNENEENVATFMSTDPSGFFGRTDDQAFWFFQMVFAATAATIVSGAVGGRIRLEAYFVVATGLTAFVYPVVSHWIFDSGGWLSGFTASEKLLGFVEGEVEPCGVIDFAGSGVVHFTGGVAAFWGAAILGPRAGWTPGTDKFPPHSYVLSTLGTLILWFGWYGFNPGSTLLWDGFTAGQVAVTTTMAPGMAGLVGIAISILRHKTWDLGQLLNSILAGLVAVTSPCATVRPGVAVVIGAIAGFVYYFGSRFNKFVLKIDDPVDAIAVHGYCGALGLLMAGLVSDGDLVLALFGKDSCDTSIGGLLIFQVLAIVSIAAWVSLFAVTTFVTLRALKVLKLSEEEQKNVDEHEHGTKAYEIM